MALRLEDLIRSITERPKLYLYILLIALAGVIAYTLLSMAITILLGGKAPVIPTFVIPIIIGILAGIIAIRLVPDVVYEVRREHPVVSILAGAIIFALVGLLYTLYTATVGPFSVFGTMPMIGMITTDILYKLAVAFIDYLIKGVLLISGFLLGAHIGASF